MLMMVKQKNIVMIPFTILLYIFYYLSGRQNELDQYLLSYKLSEGEERRDCVWCGKSQNKQTNR